MRIRPGLANTTDDDVTPPPSTGPARAATGGSNIILTCMRARVARVRLHRVPETIRTYTDMITK